MKTRNTDSWGNCFGAFECFPMFYTDHDSRVQLGHQITLSRNPPQVRLDSSYSHLSVADSPSCYPNDIKTSTTETCFGITRVNVNHFVHPVLYEWICFTTQELSSPSLRHQLSPTGRFLSFKDSYGVWSSEHHDDARSLEIVSVSVFLDQSRI